MKEYTKRQTKSFLLKKVIKTWALFVGEEKAIVRDRRTGELAYWPQERPYREVNLDTYPRGIMAGK